MKTCPYCAEEIQDAAIKCKHCGSMLNDSGATDTLDAAATQAQAPHSGAPADLDAAATITAGRIRPGDLLGARYRVLDQLGAGGMGEVWLAEDNEMDGMTVALKVLPPVLARNRASIDALKREAQIALKLTHPGICRLHTFCADADVKFLVMEHIEGQTLEDVLQEAGALPAERVIDMAGQLAEALDHAHAQNPPILHRDIKPANIMVTPDGHVKLMDFGIAREIQDNVTRLSAQSSMTVPYASPEQFTGKHMSAASDLYSFAAVLYECLAGHPLVSPHGDQAYQILQRPFEPLEGAGPAANAALAAALAKDPARRPATAHDLVAMLRGAARVPPPPPVVPVAPAPPPMPTAPPPVAARHQPAAGGTTIESLGVYLGSGYQALSFAAVAGASFLLFAIVFGMIASADPSPGAAGGATTMTLLLAVVTGTYYCRRIQAYARLDMDAFRPGLELTLEKMKYIPEADHGSVQTYGKKYSAGFGWAYRIYVEWGVDSVRLVGPSGVLKKLDKKLRRQGLV